MKRYAIVRNARQRSEAEAYLPDNYKVVYETMEVFPQSEKAHQQVFVIAGDDVAGWTLDDYVIPRYASGLIWAEEIDPSHWVMREIAEGTVV